MCPKKRDDITGMKFCRLTAIKLVEVGIKKNPEKWLCKCDCGAYKVVAAISLKRGNTKSCGCLKIEQASKTMTKHGMYKTRIYNCWSNMKHRCYYEKDTNYKNYGGRGITVCEEWLGENGFINFYNWAIENGYKEDLTIDRIDVNGNYCPENCRWITKKEQQRNKTTNVLLTFNGETMTQAEWSEKLHGQESLVDSRLRRGWTIEESLTIPANNKKWISTIRKESTKAPVSATSYLPVEQCSQEIE